MEKYKLTNEDFENLKQLFLIEFNIYNIYHKLVYLETTDKKDSEEYKKYLDSLNYHIGLEEDIYKKYASKPVKISEILFYLIGNEKNDFIFNLGCLKDDKIESIIRIRIVNRLEKIIAIDEYLNEEDISEEEYASLCMIDSEVLEELNEEITEADEIERKYFIETSIDYEIEKDILNTILRILNEYIHNPEYQKIKDKLIQYKYLLSITFKDIEIDFLEHNFEISDSLIWTSKFKADSFGPDTTYYDDSKSGYVEDIFVEVGNALVDLFDTNLDDNKNYSDAIISQIIIRVISIFSTENTISVFHSFLLDTIKERNKSNETLESIIENAFNKFMIDRELPTIISLRI